SVLFRHRVALRVAWTPATGTASRDPTPPISGDAVLENVRDDNYALQKRYYYDDYTLLRAPFGKTANILSRERCSLSALMDVYCDCCDSCVRPSGDAQTESFRELGSLDDRRELWFLMIAWLAGNSVKPSQRPGESRPPPGVLLTRIRGWSFTGSELGCPFSPASFTILSRRRNGLRKWRDVACKRKKNVCNEKWRLLRESAS
ncbi:hypothetical protein X777_12206, partial [Ooceraea biroi]